MHKIGLNIRKIREMKGIKQEEIATLLHKSQQFVSKMETGQLNIKPEEIEKIAQYFGISKEAIESFDDKLVFNISHNPNSNNGYVINYTSSTTDEILLLKEQNELLKQQLALLQR